MTITHKFQSILKEILSLHFQKQCDMFISGPLFPSQLHKLPKLSHMPPSNTRQIRSLHLSPRSLKSFCSQIPTRLDTLSNWHPYSATNVYFYSEQQASCTRMKSLDCFPSTAICIISTDIWFITYLLFTR